LKPSKRAKNCCCLLAERINDFFGTKARGFKQYFWKDSDIREYDIIFDCVDNFETRIILSEKCKENKKYLISGGTSYNAGQVVCYNPNISRQTPAEFLGLYEIVDGRKSKEYVRDRASCRYQPEPSVIMSNQIIAGIMVDKFRKLDDGVVFYDAESDKRIEVINAKEKDIEGEQEFEPMTLRS